MVHHLSTPVLRHPDSPGLTLTPNYSDRDETDIRMERAEKEHPLPISLGKGCSVCYGASGELDANLLYLRQVDEEVAALPQDHRSGVVEGGHLHPYAAIRTVFEQR